jgi:Flp pilus assembly protein TadG
MLSRDRQSIGTNGGRRRQSGATALEFALVFPIFFMLFYGTLHLGFISVTRLSLQHAAEEGARESLRWQMSDASATCMSVPPPDETPAQLVLRSECAQFITRTQTQWLSQFADPVVTAVVCLASEECNDSTPGTPPVCGNDPDTRCQMVVTASYPYATNPLIPAMPGFGIIAPASIRGQARVLIDGRAL